MSKGNCIYKCEECSALFEAVNDCNGEGCKPTCCGKEMQLLEEKTADEGKEKHVPVIEKTGAGVLVKVGSVPHPMEESHYIQWIEIIADGISYRKFLKPGDKPEALFEIKAEKIEAREYCNIHGLWRT